MNKRTKQHIYRELTRAIGDPTKLSEAYRNRLVNLLGGWLGQHSDQSSRRHLSNYSQVSYPNRYNPPAEKVNIYEKHSSKAHWIAGQPNWHWKIERQVQLPKQDAVNCRLGVPALPHSWCAPSGAKWDWMHKGSGKSIQIMVPMNYHVAVYPHGISTVDRKIVQKVWNHRVYSDKEVWECTYWDFSKLNKDEASWTNAKWQTGFVVKMAVATAVEPTLNRALSMAQSRVVRTGINSILSDADD